MLCCVYYSGELNWLKYLLDRNFFNLTCFFLLQYQYCQFIAVFAVHTVFKQLDSDDIVIIEGINVFYFTITAVYVFSNKFIIEYMNLLAYYKYEEVR